MRLKETVRILDVIQQRGFQEYSETCARLLQGCTKAKALSDGKEVHAHIIKSGFEPDIFLSNTLVSMYVKCGIVVDALQVFDKMPKRNVISWTAMIAGLAQQGLADKALALFWQMQWEGVKPNKITFMSILSACASPVGLEEGKRLHAYIIEAGLESDVRVGTALVSMYCKCGSVVDARLLFDTMLKRDVISWNAMIAGYARHGHGHEAFELFRRMQREGINPNKVTFISILNSCANPLALEEGKWLHACIIKAGFESDVTVGNALVSMYCKCRSVVDAHQVFGKMPERNVVTFISILNACSSPDALEQGKRLHAAIFKAGFESDTRVGNALVSMYYRCGSVVDACSVFDKLPKRDLISWNSMIAGFAQQGHGAQALEIFQQMQKEGMKPDGVTFMSILGGCASLTALEEGKWVHGHVLKAGCESDDRVGNALVDMYAKCGSMQDAQQVFDKIAQRNVISWTAIITGYAQHGHGKEALQLFQQMLRERVKPNDVTFIGVLSACSHMGLVDEGHHYFLSMSREHGITPTEKHYSCMVDLLGRSGRLDEAEEFINTMPFKPDAPVWGALLGACRIHGNVVLAERAAECILKLNPQNAGVYVLLSNIYAAAGRWNDIAKVRTAMEHRCVKKEPGRSWIEVKNKVHTFCVDDRSHPQTQDIYAELDRLNRKMRQAGYLPNTKCVLHDVDQQTKEQALCHHSEKLAIAFGLLSTPPGTPIRIMKNLRVCGDCHTATKFISKIVWARNCCKGCQPVPSLQEWGVFLWGLLVMINETSNNKQQHHRSNGNT